MNTVSRCLFALIALLALSPSFADEAARQQLKQLMAHFVQGWREGDAGLLSRVFAMDEGRIHWVSGSGDDEAIQSMTFRAAVDRGKTNPTYGSDGWRILSLDVLEDELAMVKLEILFGDVVSIDFMICQRVRGQWKIVSNTFVTVPRDEYSPIR